MARFDPYLNFSGNAEEAMKFYRSVFGGDLELIRFKDFPGGEAGVAADELDQLMHASLSLPDGRVLMASDAPLRMGKVQFGTSTHVMIGVDSADEARRLYAGLSEGAQHIVMPLGDAGFAELYAALQDRYGIHWMIYFAGNRAAAN